MNLIIYSYPIGGDSDYKYVVPEIHYDNPELKIGYIENVKIRYYMTKSLQANELGVLTIGSGKLISRLLKNAVNFNYLIYIDTAPFAIDLPPQVNYKTSMAKLTLIYLNQFKIAKQNRHKRLLSK